MQVVTPRASRIDWRGVLDRLAGRTVWVLAATTILAIFVGTGLAASGAGALVVAAFFVALVVGVGVLLRGSLREVRLVLCQLRRGRRSAEAELATRAERIAELERELSDLRRSTRTHLANTSHELRTPLHVVVGMSDLLFDTELTREQRDFVATLRTAGDSLLDAINDILDFSQLEERHLELTVEDVDVGAVVEDVSEMLAEKAHRKGLELVCYVDAAVPSKVAADPQRLRQVLVNLVGNAVKFTDYGDVRISVSWEEEGHVRFEVADTGIGIAARDQSRLFQSFTRLGAGRSIEGSGLGLAISRQLCELMGGEIGVESEPGVGSTFWFSLPARREGDVSPSATVEARQRPARVLLVDDSAAVRAALRDYLEGWKLQVEEALDCEQALARMTRGFESGAPFDLALVDMHLTNAGDREIVSLLCSDPALATTPILGLTPRGASPIAGVRLTVPKPVRRERLLEGIHEALEAAELVEPVMSVADGGSRILLAEDDPINQSVARRLLERLGYEVDVVADGAAAVHAARDHRYGLILLDCEMPRMGGFEAAETIRLREADRRTPIVAMTGHALNSYREQALESGMDDHLVKPVRLAALERVLNRWTRVER